MLHRPASLSSRLPSSWDLLALPLVSGCILLFAWASHQMAAPYEFGAPLPISRDPWMLPEYALRTTLRMFVALLASLLFTFVYASAAAKSRRAERLLIPILDVLQSVPILGFLSLTVLWFIHLFPHSLLGPELAAIFAIFTSQAWNMTFSFYASLKVLPHELYQVVDSFQLSAWQRFWRLEVPYAVPALVWNAMMSVSGGWFFVVASEAITAHGRTVTLPGVGSYIAVAIQHEDLPAIGWAILTMLLVVLLYDQLLFRPLVAWADKFKFEFSGGEAAPQSWVLDMIRRARWLQAGLGMLKRGWRLALGAVAAVPARPERRRVVLPRPPRGGARAWLDAGWTALLFAGTTASIVLLAQFVLTEATWKEIGRVFLLGLYTLLRVATLTVLATLIWVPISVWIGSRPGVARVAQPAALFLSAFPANLLFPVAVIGIVSFGLEPEIWLSPLMILGTQWYIVFNVIAGAAGVPNDIKEAASSLGLHGWRLWRRVWLPAVFPSYLTGGLTASGGAWNASVVAEVVSWGSTTLTATGIGAYIAQQTTAGDTPRVALGVTVMSLYVLVFNRLLWKRLYDFAQRRFTLT